jgi:hypothetical protein
MPVALGDELERAERPSPARRWSGRTTRGSSRSAGQLAAAAPVSCRKARCAATASSPLPSWLNFSGVSSTALGRLRWPITTGRAPRRGGRPDRRRRARRPACGGRVLETNWSMRPIVAERIAEQVLTDPQPHADDLAGFRRKVVSSIHMSCAASGARTARAWLSRATSSDEA